MEIDEIKSAASTNLFSKLSMAFASLNLILTILLLNSVPTTLKANEGLPIIPKPLIVVTEVSCLLGVIFSTISLVRKERLKYWKVIGAVLNFLLFLFLIGTVGFALLMDWKRSH